MLKIGKCLAVLLLPFIFTFSSYSAEEVVECVAYEPPLDIQLAQPEKSPPDEEESLGYTDDEIDLLARITMAESENQCEEGKRLVVDTVLNRVDSEHFPDSIQEVIFQKNQFCPTTNGRLNRCHVKDDIREIVVEEIKDRTNENVMFFNSIGFTRYGKPMFKVGDHYFSSMK